MNARLWAWWALLRTRHPLQAIWTAPRRLYYAVADRVARLVWDLDIWLDKRAARRDYNAVWSGVGTGREGVVHPDPDDFPCRCDHPAFVGEPHRHYPESGPGRRVRVDLPYLADGSYHAAPLRPLPAFDHTDVPDAAGGPRATGTPPDSRAVTPAAVETGGRPGARYASAPPALPGVASASVEVLGTPPPATDLPGPNSSRSADAALERREIRAGESDLPGTGGVAVSEGRAITTQRSQEGSRSLAAVPEWVARYLTCDRDQLGAVHAADVAHLDALRGAA